MRVILSHTAEWDGTAHVPAVTWTAPLSGEIGSASVVLPRTSPGASHRYLAELGGSTLTIDGGPHGRWRGIVSEPVRGEGSLLFITALSVESAMAGEPVAPLGVLPTLPAGAIVQRALAEAPGAASWLRPGTFLHSAPLVGAYELTGQSLLDVLRDMQARTAQAWSTAMGRLSWIEGAGSLFPRRLCEGGDFIVENWSKDTQDTVTQVTAVGTGNRRAVATAGELLSLAWPKRLILQTTIDNYTDLVAAAEAELGRRRFARVVYGLAVARYAGTLGGNWDSGRPPRPAPDESVRLPRKLPEHGALPPSTAPEAIDLWAVLREGQQVPIIAPSAGLSGAFSVCFVLARTASDDDGLLRLRVAELAPLDPATVAAARARMAVAYPPRSGIVETVVSGGGGAPAAPVEFTGAVLPGQIVSVPASKVTGTLTTPQYGDATVTDAKIAAMAASKLTGQVVTGQYADVSVTDAKIAAVAAAKITGTLVEAQYADASVTDAKIAAGLAATKLAGDLLAARMQTNVIAAVAAAPAGQQIAAARVAPEVAGAANTGAVTELRFTDPASGFTYTVTARRNT